MIEAGDRMLGRYRIVERLGFGGMGEVWRAVDEVLEREVAVKALARHLVANEDARERFRREAQHAGSLSHPNVVAIHDAGTEGELMVLVMELISGGHLTSRLREHGTPSVEEGVRIAGQILSGLAAAHRAGLVHRDVKPANVMFTATGEVKLTDFGIARVARGETTRTAEVYGSAPYIAPELAHGAGGGPASDVYAAGCVLYELLTGTSPFTGETPAVTIARHLQYHPPRPSTLQPEVSPELDAVVMRALAKDPADRYGDAGEMLVDLERVAERSPLAGATVALVRRLSLRERRRVRSEPGHALPLHRPSTPIGWWVAAATVALAAAVIVALLAR